MRISSTPRNGTHSADRNCNQSRPSPQFRTKRVSPQDLIFDQTTSSRAQAVISVWPNDASQDGAGRWLHKRFPSLICCWRHLTPKIWEASEISKPPETDSQGTLVIAFSEASEKHDIARKDFSASNCQTLCGLIKTRWNLQIASKTLKLFFQCYIFAWQTDEHRLWWCF